MLINDIDIKKYNARILDVDIQNSNINNISNLDIKNRLLPLFFNSKVGLNQITVTLLVNSLDKKQYYLDKSNILNDMIEPCYLYFKDRGLRFRCILLGQLDKPSLRQIRGELQLQFIGYNVQDEVTEVMNRIKTKTINVSGNMKTPIILEITPIVDTIEVNIEGLSDDPLVVKNLKQDKTLIINGINGTVTQDGANRFADVDMWEFPFLVPGLNKITVNKDACNINIKYNPRFL